jgi:hypothetical protein
MKNSNYTIRNRTKKRRTRKKWLLARDNSSNNKIIIIIVIVGDSSLVTGIRIRPVSRVVSYRILIKAFSVLIVNTSFTFGSNMFRPSITAFLSLGAFTRFFMHFSLA